MAYVSTYDRLTSEGFAPEKVLQIRPKISVSENGKHYLLETNGTEESAVFTVDGVIVKEGLRCDKLVLVKMSGCVEDEQWTEVFVELKGGDAAHAIDQLRESLKNKVFSHSSNKSVRARIVAQSFPSNKSNPVMEKAKQEFRRLYKCDLRGMKSNQVDRL